MILITMVSEQIDWEWINSLYPEFILTIIKSSQSGVTATIVYAGSVNNFCF